MANSEQVQTRMKQRILIIKTCTGIFLNAGILQLLHGVFNSENHSYPKLYSPIKTTMERKQSGYDNSTSFFDLLKQMVWQLQQTI